MSSLFQKRVHEKPIIHIIYQPWDSISKEHSIKWKAYRSLTFEVRPQSCLDALDLIKTHRIRRYPCALITDIYGHTRAVPFNHPWDISSIEISAAEDA